MLRKLWRDQCGATVSAEITVVGTVLVIGVLVGWVMLRNVLFVELSNQAEWIAGGEHEEHYIEIDDFDIVTCNDVFNNNGEGDPQ